MKKVHLAPRMVKGLHRFTLERYSVCKGLWRGAVVYSSPFSVGAHQWAIAVYPSGKFSPLTEDLLQCVGFRVCLLSETKERVATFLSITLLDQTGQGNHRSISSFRNSKDPLKFVTKQHLGFPNFITQEALSNSCYLKDDCLKIECRLAILLPSQTEIQIERPILQSGYNDDDDDDNVSNFRALLESGEGSDVTIYVGKMKFQVHKVILAARSSFFDSIFDSINQREKIFLTDIEPQVFKVVLHFIYTDTLPKNERSLVAGYAFESCLSATIGAKLLAAAEGYGLKRLKSICESHLWRNINLNCLTEMLILAKTYNASMLEGLCLHFAASNVAALKELDTFDFFKKNYPLLFKKVDGDSAEDKPANLNHQISTRFPGVFLMKNNQQRKQAEENERPTWRS